VTGEQKSGLGEPDAAPRTDHQRNAQPCLSALQVLADRRLAEAQLARRARDRARLGDGTHDSN
jgi:hypothetical protein